MIFQQADCCANAKQGGIRKTTSVLSWILPSALLLLIPKCPLCVAAFIAVATGLGVSVSTAAGVRTAIIAGCSGLLIFALFRTLNNFRVFRAP